MDRKKILLDTDIGEDIDDCFALVMLLNLQKQAEIVGVTTVFGDSEKRARIAKKMLALRGVKVPVYAGRRKNYAGDADVCARCPQYGEEVSGSEYAPDNDVFADEGEAAVDFIVESVKKYGKDLTIVAIGPLTNVASAIKKNFEVMKNAHVVLMGGDFFGALNEWNIVCDPEAAKIVMESGLNVECLGLDVTRSLELRRYEYEKIVAHKPDEFYEYVCLLLKRYSDYMGVLPMLHDPLAVYYALTGKDVLMRKQLIKVDVDGTYSRGRTVNIDELFMYEHSPRPGDRINVACAVNSRDFVRLFLSVYTGETTAV